MKQKVVKRIFASLLVVIMLFASVPLVGNMSANTIITSASNGPKLNCTSKTLEVNASYTLKVSGTKSKITWSTSDKKVATVSSKGKVTAKGVGTATIYAKFNKTTLKCKITVVKLNYTSKSIYYKSNVTLKVSGTNSKITWSTSDKNIATVNSKGVVTGKSIGTATISAKFGKTTLKCKITVKDRNQGAETSFKTSDGGIFIYATNTAVAKFKLKSYDSAKVTVSVLNSEDKSVYNKTFTSLKKNTYYQFNWDGKNTKGNIVPAGTYRIMVKAGTTKSYSAYLSFYTVNDFAGGNGSSKNPFQIKTVAQLKKIVKYPSANFKQMNDLDFNYSGMSVMFTEDKMFSGVYDGNGKTIKNMVSNSPIFNYSYGTIKNLKFNNCNVIAENGAILINDNCEGGIISNCSFVKCSVSSQTYGAFVGIVASLNGGTINNCTVNGSISSSGTNIGSCIGGIVGGNADPGKIINCSTSVDVLSDGSGVYRNEKIGGITGYNKGTVVDCESSGSIECIGDYTAYASIGGISGKNSGTIINSCYTGSTKCSLVGDNTGIIS